MADELEKDLPDDLAGVMGMSIPRNDVEGLLPESGFEMVALSLEDFPAVTRFHAVRIGAMLV